MSIEIKVPSLGESVSEATVAKWFKSEGDAVAKDEQILELETDKVTLEVNAPAAGVLKSIKAKEGSTVEPGGVLGLIEEGAAGVQKSEARSQKSESSPLEGEQANAMSRGGASSDVRTPPHDSAKASSAPPPGGSKGSAESSGPAARKLLAENPQVNLAALAGSGKDGRFTKGDVLSAIRGGGASATTSDPANQKLASSDMPAFGGTGAQPAQRQEAKPLSAMQNREERVRMSKLRQTIARRLKESQNTAAILTTFNEIDMTNVIALRNEYKDIFEKKHGVRLGFMSFFIRAAVEALKELPAVNAHIEGDEIVYKHFYNIGVAVGTDQGLVVPVVRDADQMSLAEMEGEIARLAGKARDGSLSMADLSGGTFTVTNGGVYGSLMATPIINPPQSGILGMHKVEKRPVAVNDQVVIRPMMYVALSYDHRIIDGRESVTFLVRVKEAVEDPRRLLLGV